MDQPEAKEHSRESLFGKRGGCKFGPRWESRDHKGRSGRGLECVEGEEEMNALSTHWRDRARAAGKRLRHQRRKMFNLIYTRSSMRSMC